ncbi:MAG: hypothetical protein OEZ68_15855 [Gammaproteobacteria bacterium]|nr:hypothetical protein [Gammaproteobacteria bacterium]MDH5802276.1 hypothetical protein [Gammaproteobacteria bacterium]
MKWPGGSLFRKYMGVGTLLYLQCFLVYGFTNWWATRQADWYRWYFQWELSLPFVPTFVYVYLSLVLFLLLPMFYLRETALKPWALSYTVMTLVAGIIFFTFPTTLAIPRASFNTDAGLLFSLIYTLDMPHNLFPSLHVAYTTFVMHLAFYFSVPRIPLLLMMFWWLLLSISVLLVHQHHMVDIVGGMVLSYLCYRWVFLPGLADTGETLRLSAKAKG